MKSLFAVTGIAAAVILSSCGGGEKPKTPEKKDTVKIVDTVKAPELPTLVDVVTTNPDFSVLAGLLQEAGLVGALSEAGKSFTVFAPNNAAFAKIKEADLAALKKDKNKLAEVLSYHVVAGVLKAADLQGREELDALSGHVIKVAIKDGKVWVGSNSKDPKTLATVITADQESKNGVIHIIDAVIMPPKAKTKAKPAPETNTNTDTKTEDPKKSDGTTKGDKFGGTSKENETKSDKFGGDATKENKSTGKGDKFGGSK